MVAPLDMRPSQTPHDMAYVGLFYAIFFGKLSLVDTSGGIATANLQDIGLGEFRSFIVRAAHTIMRYWATYVLPLFSIDDIADRSFGYAETFTQFSLGYVARCVKLSDFYHLFIYQLCHSVRDTLLASRPVLLIAVMRIVCGRSRKEVFGITAKRIIPTWAIVASEQAVGNWAISQFVGDAVRGKHFAIIGFEFAVTFDNSSLPQPAVILSENVDVRPKAFGEGYLEALGMTTRNVFSLVTKFFGYFEGLTTTTLTQRGKMKFELREARGIIHDADYLPIGIGTTQAMLSTSLGYFLRLILPYFSTNGRVLQQFGGAA